MDILFTLFQALTLSKIHDWCMSQRRTKIHLGPFNWQKKAKTGTEPSLIVAGFEKRARREGGKKKKKKTKKTKMKRKGNERQRRDGE